VSNDATNSPANNAPGVGSSARPGCESTAFGSLPTSRFAKYATVVWLLQLAVPTIGLVPAVRRLQEPYPSNRLAPLLITFCLVWYGACFLVLAVRAGRRWIASHAAQLIGLYVSVTASLAAAEVICRMLDSTEQPWRPGGSMIDYSPVLGWTLAAGVGDTGTHGWRGPSVPRTKRDGQFRIACLGDSTTFGYLCSWAEAWPHQLEVSLNQDADWTRSHGITEVLNLGVSGYGPDQSMLALKEYGLSYSPDIVIFHLCLNDFADVAYDRNVTPGGFTRYKPSFVLKDGHLVPVRDRVPLPRDPEGHEYHPGDSAHSARSSHFFQSALWQFVRKQAHDLSTGAWRKDPLEVSQPQYWPINDAFRAKYAKTRPLVWAMIREMSRVANEAGAEFLVTLSPANMKFVSRPEDAPPWRVATFLREYHDDADALGIPALDYAAEYFAEGGNKRFVIEQDGYHLNPQGNALVGQAAARWLKTAYPAAKLRGVVSGNNESPHNLGERALNCLRLCVIDLCGTVQ